MRENDEMKNYNLVYFYVYGFIVRGRVRLIDNSGQIVTFFASVHYFSWRTFCFCTVWVSVLLVELFVGVAFVGEAVIFGFEFDYGVVQI